MLNKFYFYLLFISRFLGEGWGAKQSPDVNFAVAIFFVFCLSIAIYLCNNYNNYLKHRSSLNCGLCLKCV